MEPGVGEIERFIVERLKHEHSVELGRDDSLALAGLDSVTMAELTLTLERQFAIRVDDSVLDVDTIAELAAYVQMRRPADGRQPAG